MKTQFYSKALWFIISVLGVCPAVQGRDHEIEIYTTGNQFNYNHKKGYGVNGFVFVKKTHSVQWSCEKNDPKCDQIEITFPSGNPCTSSTLGPAPTASCDGIDVKTPVPCTKGGKGKSCVPYTTTVYFNGHAQNLTEDPEFIVDDNKNNLLVPAALGFLALVIVGYVAFRWGKIQGRRAAP